MSEATQAWVVMSSVAVMFCGLGASYFWYRHLRRKDTYPITFGEILATVDPATANYKRTMNNTGLANRTKVAKSAAFDD